MNFTKKYSTYLLCLLALSTFKLSSEIAPKESLLSRYGKAAVFGIVPPAPPVKRLYDFLEIRNVNYPVANIIISGSAALFLTSYFLKLAIEWDKMGVKRPLMFLSGAGVIISISLEAFEHLCEIISETRESYATGN